LFELKTIKRLFGKNFKEIEFYKSTIMIFKFNVDVSMAAFYFLQKY